MKTYTANLILLGKIKKSLEFQAKDKESAVKEANDGIELLNGGLWIEVKEKRVFEHQENINEN